MTSSSDPKREFLRHSVATLAYRGGKAVRNAPEGFAEFSACESGRTAGQILAHIGDLFDWGLSIAQGQQKWKDSEPLPWDKEVEPLLCRAQEFRRLPGFGGAAACAGGEALSGSDCRCPDPRGTDRDAAADGRRADEEAKFISSLKLWTCGTGADRAQDRILIEGAVVVRRNAFE